MVPTLLSMPSSATVSVEKATSHLLMVPDWTLNMEICDAINTDPLHAKDFVKAVKKRLQNKNPRVQFLALMLLETMIKNCGDFVHFQVVDREILQDMVKTARRTADIQVRDKILVLLDCWQEAFGGAGGKYPQYYYAYAELKTAGIRFPEHQKDAALIYTPTAPTFPPHVGHGTQSNSVERLDESIERGIVSLTDLKNIRSVMELFVDMLQALNPQDHMALKDEVIIDLASQCGTNQKKIMQLINSTENEELLGEALALFENLQNSLTRYDALLSGSPLPPETVPASTTPNIIPPSAPMIQQLDDRAVEEVEPTHLARRDSKSKSTDDQQVSPNLSDTTPTSTSGVSEASSSIPGNALVPLDPPIIETTPKKDDIMDLLSLVLSTDSPETPPPTQNQNPFLNSPDLQPYANNPQPYAHNPPPLGSNGSYATYNSYVAPWAQSSAPLPTTSYQQQVMQYPYGYQSSSWIPTSGVGSNPFLSTPSFQYPAPRPTMAPSPPAAAPTAPTPFTVPAPTIATTASAPIQNSMAIEMYKTPLGSNNLKQTVRPSATKPYTPPDKLFEGLIELRNPDGSLKSRNAAALWGSSSDVMTGGRK